MKDIILFSVILILFPVMVAGFIWKWITKGWYVGADVAEIYDNWLKKD